jgi:MFS family permease
MSKSATSAKTFWGWWMVVGCMAIAVIAWSFALYGPSVYLHTISQQRGWSIGLVSSALTLSFLVNASVLIFVGPAIARYGAKPMMMAGSASMAIGLTSMGQVTQIWQIYPAFALMGLGWSCLSTTALTTTLAPWFSKFQGRAVSTAMLGASVGGMVGVPFLLALIDGIGFESAMLCAGLMVLIVVWPISFFVLKRRPQDIGLHPDGLSEIGQTSATDTKQWTRKTALRTTELRTVMLAFGLALMVQIGFLTHQVSMLLPVVGSRVTGLCVTAAAFSAFLARMLLARFSDRMDVRLIAAGVLLQATIAVLLISILPTTPWALVLGVVLYGMTAGNVTTLPPIIVRREFGASSFGIVFGICAMIMQLMSAMGPGVFGLLFDWSGSYRLPLAIAALMNLISAAIVLRGRKKSD